ncbi:MAG: hypothetical protein U9M90_02475 [Patescibacteria group bacterium]|nr:hypothetical protein [Patescibacteria group bacterium]
MEQQNNYKSASGLKNIWVILVSVAVIAILISGGVYFFRIPLLEYFVGKSQQAIIDSVDINDLILVNCVDSDASEIPDDVYVKGGVTYTNKNGETHTIYDECLTGSNHILNERQCVLDEKRENYYKLGKQSHKCPNGCIDGACIK